MTYFSNANFKAGCVALFTASTFLFASCSNAKTEAQAVQAVQNEIKTEAQRFEVKHVDAQGAQALLSANPDALILDVRTPKEIADGHIEGAVFADFMGGNFAQDLSALDKSAPYIVHCASGGRSTKALSVLESQGFTNITHMDGGIAGWKRASLPLTKP